MRMLGVLLVDDEELTLDYLEKMPDWERFGFQVQRKATGGRDAMESIRLDRIDLVVTDIEMPVMDGLSLIGEIRNTSPDLRIIVLSAFSEFEYARRSYDMGISGYLLKPVDETKLESLLSKIREEITTQNEEKLCREKQSEITRNSLLKSLILDGRGEKWRIKRAKEAGAALNLGIFQMLVIMSGDTRINDGEMIRSCWFKACGTACTVLGRENGTWLLMDEANQGTQLLSIFLENLQHRTGGRIIIGVSLTHRGTSELLDAYREVVHLENVAFYSKGKQIIQFRRPSTESKPKMNIDNEKDRFIDAMRNGGGTEVAQYIDGLCERMQYSFGSELESLRIFTAAWLTVIRSVLLDDDELNLPPGLTDVSMQRINSFRHIDELAGFLRTLSRDMIDLPIGRYGHEDSSLIGEVQSFVKANYHLPFTLDELAVKMGRNKNYLCRIFKVGCNERIWDYVTDLRMKKASYLLINTSLRIHSVAQRVGYGNPSYFSRVFRRHTGKNPQAYRRDPHQ